MRWGMVLIVLAATACLEPAHPACSDCQSERTSTWQFQTSVSRAVDLLVVVDDTPATAERQALDAGYRQFATVLENLPGGTPSLHAMFVPAALPSGACSPPGARGPACGLAPPTDYVTALSCGEQPNVAGSMADAFACLGDFGAEACGAAQPLEAMRRALIAPGGFLRPGAFLQVVIVAGGDDASARAGALVPVAEYVDLLRVLKADPGMVAVSAIVPGPSCPGAPALEAGAPRLAELVNAFVANGVALSICGDNLSYALVQLAEQIAKGPAPSCVGGLRDVDPARPGLQPECAVEGRADDVYGQQHRTSLPSCDHAPAPCWRLLTDPACPGSWLFDVDRGPVSCRPLSTRTEVSCLGCVDAADPACAGP